VRVLVTGGAGFIGSHLVDLAVAGGHEVSVLDSLDPQVHGGRDQPLFLLPHLQAGRVRFVRGDVADREVVDRALEDVDAVAHLAAAVGVGQSMYEPYHYVRANDLGAASVLQAVVARRDRVRRLVVASSMSLYGEGAYQCPSCGGRERTERTEEQLQARRWEIACAACGADMAVRPTPETKPAEIASVYAASKKTQEDLFVSFGRAYAIPTMALRLFNVFGPRQSLGNPYTGVAAIFLSRFLAGKRPIVFEDGRQTRDFVDVRDVARAFLMALESNDTGQRVVNVGTGRPLSVLVVGRALAATLGVDLEPELLGKYRAGDVRHCISDPSRAREVLGFEARHRFEDGLPALIAWCRTADTSDRQETSVRELEARGLVR
jgi:dTDP-L-rhamnose 4-epimerase